VESVVLLGCPSFTVLRRLINLDFFTKPIEIAGAAASLEMWTTRALGTSVKEGKISWIRARVLQSLPGNCGSMTAGSRDCSSDAHCCKLRV